MVCYITHIVCLLTGKIMKEPECILVKYLTDSICLNRCSMSLSCIRGECPNVLINNTVEYLIHSVCFIHWYNH